MTTRFDLGDGLDHTFPWRLGNKRSQSLPIFRRPIYHLLCPLNGMDAER